jgi:DNA-directed RNA polymerase I, II, and III subunit RPABC2
MADEMTLGEYNAALDTMAPADDGMPEEPEDVGGGAIQTADALGITEAPTVKTHALLEQHPEIRPDYEETVAEKMMIREAYPPLGDGATKGETGDKRHCTYPFLTLYERTKILALRASQLAHGAAPFIDVPEYLTDSYEIAKAELEAKRLPYILKRPLPNGDYEYWRLADLILLQ